MAAFVAGAAVVTTVTAGAAGAAGSYDNAAIATAGLGHVGQVYGECWPFVRDMVYAASGHTQDISAAAGGTDYFLHLQNAGGTRITDINALAKGDVVQQGEHGGHTFIIVSKVSVSGGSATYNVVDSNHAYDNRVANYNRTFALGNDERAYRMGSIVTSRIMGSLDNVHRVPGGIAAGGWAIDSDQAGPINVDTYGGTGAAGSGNPGARTLADGDREDVGRTHPGYGPHHGFTTVVHDQTPGTRTVCSYGINAPGTPGGNAKLGCRSIVVSNVPFGRLDGVSPVAGGVDVQGWAIDPDTDAAIHVDLYGGTGAAGSSNPGLRTTADATRSDVAAAYPGYSSAHGYGGFFPLASGRQTVCAYAINAAGTAGANVQLACATVTVPAG